MKRYLLDTNSAGYCIFKRRGVRERVMQARREGNRVGIGMPVLADLFAGVENSATRDRNLDIVNRNVNLFRLWPFDAQAAREYGRLFAVLRKLGRPIGVADMMIAAIALSMGNCTVVTTDTDLTAVPELNVENWTT